MSRMVLGGLRALVVIALVAASFSLAYRFGWERYRINILKRQIENRTVAAIEGSPSLRARRIAAENIRAASAALERFPSDLDLHLELAANYRLTGDLKRAERTYRRALRISRRPEVFLNLGEVELQLGDFEGATEAFTAVYHHNPRWLDPEPLRIVEERLREASREE